MIAADCASLPVPAVVGMPIIGFGLVALPHPGSPSSCALVNAS
jgi:hypothetical protein